MTIIEESGGPATKYKELIWSMREGGHDLRTIGDHIGVTKERISQILFKIRIAKIERESHLRSRFAGLTDREQGHLLRNEKICRLNRKGLTDKEIGLELTPWLSAVDVRQLIKRMENTKSILPRVLC